METIATTSDADGHVATRRFVHAIVKRVSTISLAAIENHADRERAQNRCEPTGVVAVRNRLTRRKGYITRIDP